MASRGTLKTPENLGGTVLTNAAGPRFIWDKKKLKANDVVESFQNIILPLNYQPAHEALSAAATVTPTIIKKQIIVIAPDAGNNDLTLSTTAVLVDGLFGGSSGVSTRDIYDSWTLHVIVTNGNTATIVAGDGSTSTAGEMIVAANSSASFNISLSTGGNTVAVKRAS